MSELQPGTLVTKAVRLLRPLGQGGMGKVWVADHLGLRTQVVVKFIAKETAAKAEAIERFEREAAAAAAVKSPHVVQVFDHGVTDDGVPYIVMELLEGRDLAAHLEAHGKMAPADVAAIVAQVAKALGKAHQVGVIHRDIKPENVFLCDGEGGELFVKLLDFGIAKSEQRATAATTTGQVVGTPFYMSPEQIVGKKIDARTDIWSLGVVAFEALTGKRPFEGETIGAVTLAIHTTSPKPSTLAPELPPEVDAWFEKACAREPSARFATAREAASALLAAVGAPQGPTLVRAPLPSIVGDGSDPALAATHSSSPAIEPRARASTNLSSTFPIAPKERKPSGALLGASIAAVLVLGGAAFFALRSGGTDAPHGAASATSAPLPPPSAPSRPAAEPVTSAAPATTASAEPVASASAAPIVSAAVPHAPKPTPRPAGTTTTKPRPRRPTDDDIK